MLEKLLAEIRDVLQVHNNIEIVNEIQDLIKYNIDITDRYNKLLCSIREAVKNLRAKGIEV